MKEIRLATISEALIERVARRIVAACQPEALYLFGSAARGEGTEGSDLDLLVVMDVPAGAQAYEKASEIQALFRGGRVPLDIIVQTPEQFARERRLPGFVARTAAREGRLLFETPSFTEAPMSDSSPQEGARAWLKKAHSDLRMAGALMDLAPPELGGVAFHSQQAAEKCLKAFLACHSEEPPHTHDLKELLDRIVSRDDHFETFREAVELMDRYAVSIRYPEELSPSEDQAARALRHAEEICHTVQDRMTFDV